MTHNQRQMFMATMYRLATNDTLDLDLRYAIARDMQRKSQTVVTRETLFRLRETTRKVVYGR